MNLNRFIKEKDEILVCPFCRAPLTLNDHPYFIKQGRIGYDCLRCIVPDVKTVNDKPYSRYSITIIENVTSNDGNVIPRIIAVETFVMHITDNRWYNIHNNLFKEQTNISVVEPARPEHFYEGEKVVGLVHIGNIVWFPLIDTWDLSDQAGTLSKIRTYMLFS